MTQQRGTNTVFLESLDGFEFEELCARIYRQLGYRVENIQSTGDEGRDLVLNSPDGETIVVECKHWSKGTVGRPVLQKLHSAMLTYPAKRGAVITTGSFAKQALGYIDKVAEDIQLIDLPKLRALALQAGINVISGPDSMPLLVCPVSPDKALEGRLDQALFSKLASSPAQAASLFNIRARRTTWDPAYVVRYSVNQDFSTSVGLIHSINVHDETLLLSAEDGEEFLDQIVDLLETASLHDAFDAHEARGPSDMPPFVLGATEITETAKGHIRKLHTRIVRYQGRNGQQYRKECVPTKRHISLNDIAQVYIPLQEVEVAALKTQYELGFIEGDDDFFCLEHTDLRCRQCSQPTSRTPPQVSEFLSALSQGVRAQICNTCGAITHLAAWWFPHSFLCASCRKTICRSCAYWVPKLALFKRILCDTCADSLLSGATRKLTK